MQLVKLSYCLLFPTVFLTTSLLSAGQPPKKENKSVNEQKKALVAKIGIVDRSRIVTQNPAALDQACHEWKDLFTRLQDLLKEPSREAVELEEKCRKGMAEVEALQKLLRSGLSTKEAVMNKYQELVAPFAEQLQRLDQELQRVQYDELTKAHNIVLPKLKKAADQVKAAQGWDWIIWKDGVASEDFNKNYEITDEVIALLNKNYAEEKNKAAKKN